MPVDEDDELGGAEGIPAMEDVSLDQFDTMNAFDEFFKVFDRDYQYDPEQELPARMEELVTELHRQRAEPLRFYVRRLDALVVKLRELKIDWPEPFLGWILLYRAAIPSWQIPNVRSLQLEPERQTSYWQHHYSWYSGDALAHSQYRRSGRAFGDPTSARQASLVGTASRTTRTKGKSATHLAIGQPDASSKPELVAQQVQASSGNCGCAAYVRLTNSSPHALHTGDGMNTTARPSVRAVNPCRKARSVEPTRTDTVITAAF